MNEYALGTDVVCSVIFENNLGAEADPTTVTFRLRDPEGESTAFVYNDDAQVVRTAAGRFYVIVDASKPGTWIYRFESTGAVKAADEESFKVLESAFS